MFSCALFSLVELFYTEKSHVRNLKLLDILFHQPMTLLAKTDGRLRDLVDIIFPSLPALIKVHEELNDDMKSRMKENPLVSIKDVVDILNRRVSLHSNLSDISQPTKQTTNY